MVFMGANTVVEVTTEAQEVYPQVVGRWVWGDGESARRGGSGSKGGQEKRGQRKREGKMEREGEGGKGRERRRRGGGGGGREEGSRAEKEETRSGQAV